MKKVLAPAILIAALLNIISCNNGGEQNKDAKAKKAYQFTDAAKIILTECDGLSNYAIEEAEAKEMKKHFHELYLVGSDLNGRYNLSGEVWIDASILRGYGKLFETAGDVHYDGLRFINAVKDDSGSVVLVPTISTDSGHTNMWGQILKIIDETKFRNYDLKKDEAMPLTGQFEKRYRNKRIKWDMEPTGPIDSLSKSVWICDSVIMDLKKIMDGLVDTDNEVDGIKVVFGAYNNMNNPAAGQQYANQSTIILIPTHGDTNGGHLEDYTLIGKVAKLKDNKAFNKVYNHGELCPNFCSGQ